VYGKYGIAMIVDEGGMGLEKLYNQEFALPGIAEKGYMVISSALISFFLSDLIRRTQRLRSIC
jgi:hypothetical protein